MLFRKADDFFKISQRQSTFQTEIFAGISTFLSLSYIIVLNPAILSKGGFDVDSVLFATALASGLSSILMGVWAKLPFALAPGLEMNGFVAFSAIGVMGLSVGESLGAVFWSGLLCILLTLLPIRKEIINAIPFGLQASLAASVGCFVFTIGLFISKVVAFEGGFPTSLSFNLSHEVVSLFVGLGLVLVLREVVGERSRVATLFSRASFLLAIIVSTIYCRHNGISPEAPPKIGGNLFKTFKEVDFFPFLNTSFFTVFLVLFLIDFFGSIGKFIGLTAGTNLYSKESGLEGIEKAMYVDGIGTVGGALLGTTSIITYVESAIGIKAGGRTGLVSVVVGVLMIFSLIFTPIISLVPVVATAGVLVYVGYALLPIEEWRRGSLGRFDLVIGFFMGLLSILTFSLDRAMLFGFLAYSLKQIMSKDEKVNPYLLISSLLLLFSVSSQYLLKN